jgi:hypothetical protein
VRLENHIWHGFYGEVDNSWILRVQNKYKLLFQNENVYGGR